MLRFPRTAAAFAVLLSVAACSGSDKAAGPDAASLPDVQFPELSLQTLQSVTKELSSDAYEGRAPGTAGEEKTLAYLIKQFEDAGLKPGNNGKWTQDVPLVEITAKNATAEEVNAAMKAASEGELKGILAYSSEPLVSSDFNHDSHSSSFASAQTKVMGGNLVRILSWYDNEWGFSNRMADTTVAMGKLL